MFSPKRSYLYLAHVAWAGNRYTGVSYNAAVSSRHGPFVHLRRNKSVPNHLSTRLPSEVGVAYTAHDDGFMEKKTRAVRGNRRGRLCGSSKMIRARNGTAVLLL